MSMVNVDKKGKFAVISLNKEPVNSMNLDLWKALSAAIQDCDQDPKIRGVIFTSGSHILLSPDALPVP